MKHFPKHLIILLTILLSLSVFLPVKTCAKESEHTADILFLHDTHSHLDSFLTVQNDEQVTVGGFSNIMTLINAKKSENPDTLLLDAGDFSMGTLVQTICDSAAPELRMLGALGCEATTLGNHEFDYRSDGLASTLYAAAESGDTVPAMVLCNIDWKTMEAEGLTEEQKLLKAAFEAYGMTDYTIIVKGGIRIAVLGIFGEDALSTAPTCVLKFKDASAAAAETVQKIRETENVDMIVCVSHSGTNEKERKSEDEILAKKVPEIDLIISGHSHTLLEEPIRHGDTYIVSCGEYGKNLGSLSMRQKDDGRWEMTAYDLLPVTPEIPKDKATQEKINSFMNIVDKSYLSMFDYRSGQVLAQNDIVFSAAQDLHSVHTDHNLANLLTDSFTYAVESAQDFDGVPVDVSIVPSGCVRDSFPIGDITVTDVFNAYSLGIGADGIPGYPLISFYLTGRELKTGAEIDASLSDLMPAARLYTDKAHYTFNPNRLILNRVTDCYLTDKDGNRVELEDDRLYRVVCDLYSGQMLSTVTDLSYGLLSVQPKFADGAPIENIEDAILLTNGRELKAWAAIASYMESFEDTNGDGIPNIPSNYESGFPRKTVEDSHDLGSLLKKPNKYAVIIVTTAFIVLTLAAVLLTFIIKLSVRFIRKSHRTPKQIAALVSVVLLASMYIVTLIVACLDLADAGRLFGICLLMTIALPILLWIFLTAHP